MTIGLVNFGLMELFLEIELLEKGSIVFFFSHIGPEESIVFITSSFSFTLRKVVFQ